LGDKIKEKQRTEHFDAGTRRKEKRDGRGLEKGRRRQGAFVTSRLTQPLLVEKER